jgi:hypothetical protein
MDAVVNIMNYRYCVGRLVVLCRMVGIEGRKERKGRACDMLMLDSYSQARLY